MARRANYLHYLANLNEDEMLYRVFITQWKFPIKDDWTEEAKANFKQLKINLSLDEIKKKSKNSFKRLYYSQSKD